MLCRIRPRRTAQDSTLPEGDAESPEENLAQGSRGCISPQILLCLLKRLQQVSKQLPNPWRLLWLSGSVDRQDGVSRGDLLQGQQGLLQQFRSDAVGGQGARWSDATTHRVPTVGHRELMHELHNGRKPSRRVHNGQMLMGLMTHSTTSITPNTEDEDLADQTLMDKAVQHLFLIKVRK